MLDWRVRRGLAASAGSSGDAAEIATGEVRILVRENIGFHVADRRLPLVLCKIDIHSASPAQVFQGEVGSHSGETIKFFFRVRFSAEIGRASCLIVGLGS